MAQIQPQVIQPVAMPGVNQQLISNAQTSQQQFQALLDKLTNVLAPTTQDDPLAPVGVTPGRDVKKETTPSTPPSGATGGSQAPSDDGAGLFTKLLASLGGSDEEKTKEGAAEAASGGKGKKSSKSSGSNLGALLDGKMDFKDTKLGQAAETIQGLAKLMKVFI